MDRIGRELLNQSKEELRRSGGMSEQDKNGSRDLLTLLLRANTSTDLPEHQRMSDEDVLARKFHLFISLYPLLIHPPM